MDSVTGQQHSEAAHAAPLHSDFSKAPTSAERAALREFCTCEKVLNNLQSGLRAKTAPLFTEAATIRSTIMEAFQENNTKCMQYNGVYYRLIQRGTTKAITPAMVHAVVLGLCEDQIVVQGGGKPIIAVGGGGAAASASRQKAVEKAILAGVRQARTTVHPSLSITKPEEPPKSMVESPPLPKALRPAALKLLQTRDEIAAHRKAAREAREETMQIMSQAAIRAAPFVRRVQSVTKGKPINITVDYDDGTESDKFSLNLKKRHKKRGLPAKEFAAIVATCIKEADVLEGDDGAWKESVAARIVAAIQAAVSNDPAADEEEPEPKLRAILKRKREPGQAPPGAYDEDEEEDEEGGEEDEDYEDME
jgi:hypothetical protein